MLWHDWCIRYAAPILFAFVPAFMSAHPIFELSVFVLSIAAAIFVVVFAVLAYSLVKFRRRLEDNSREHPQVYGGNQAGLEWTLLPILVVVTLFWQSVSDRRS